MLVLNQLTGFGARRRASAPAAMTLSFVDSAIGGDSVAENDITIPAGAAIGDFAVLTQYTQTAANAGLPSGWTNAAYYTGASGRIRIAYRVLLTGDPGLNFATDNNAANILMVFRPSVAIGSVTVGSAAAITTNANPSAQVVTSSAAAAPVIVFGVVGSSGDVGFSTFSPAADGTVTNPRWVTGYNSARSDAGYKIYNSAPADVTIDKADDGNYNALASCYFEIAA